MSSAKTIIQPPSLTEADEILLSEIYKNPTLQKHLIILAMNDSLDLLSLSSRGLSNDELAKSHEYIKGKLSFAATLLGLGLTSNKE